MTLWIVRLQPANIPDLREMLTGMRTIWIMNAGRVAEKDERLRLWREDGYVAMGYDEVNEPVGPDLEVARTTFARAYSDGTRTDSTDSRALQLHCFASTVAIGDIVIVRDSAHLHLGMVTGGYRFDPADADRCRHRRSVRWLSSIERTDVLARAAHCPGTIRPSRDDGVSNHRSALITAFAVSRQWLAPEESVNIAPTNVAAHPVQHDGQRLADAHSEHNETVNDIDAATRALGMAALGSGMMADVCWISFDGWLTVGEVKSVNGDNDVEQLRLGLGQIIDYLDQLSQYEPGVSGLLWTSRQPRDAERWRRLCARHGVTLGWPGLEHLLVDRA